MLIQEDLKGSLNFKKKYIFGCTKICRESTAENKY